MRELMKHNSSSLNFSKLKEVSESSIEGKLFGLLDDIDTAFDMFKPEMKGFEKYTASKIKEARKLIVSDGYKIYYKNHTP